MIKNIVFDIGMVLADFRWEAYMRDDLHFNEEVIKTIGESGSDKSLGRTGSGCPGDG